MHTLGPSHTWVLSSMASSDHLYLPDFLCHMLSLAYSNLATVALG